MLKSLFSATEKSWDDPFNIAKDMKFKSWPIDKKIVLDIKDEAKVSRDSVKNKLMKVIKEILVYDSESAYRDIYEMHEVLEILENVILKFDENFNLKKHEKNIIDFNDIEHYALKILVKENGKNYEPTEVAKKYQEKFEEIAIDEYQDSNEVQELILKSVSRGNNLFMVGDVKQSIYKFRGGCPTLFLQKYDNYSLAGNDKGLKIQLFKNFRSRENILNITNSIFESIMSKNLGDIDYNEEEYLNLGADFEEIENGVGISELDIIDLKENDENDYFMQSSLEDENRNEELKQIQKEEIEAKFVAKKIEEI